MRTIDEVVGFLRATAVAADGGSLPLPVGVFARAYHRITLEIVARMKAEYDAAKARLGIAR